MTIRLSHPLPSGRATDAFGWRAAIPGIMPAQLHTGQDWAAPAGTPILAMHAGRVNRVWWDVMNNGSPAGGNMLQIGSAQCSTRYAHMSGYAVSLGDEVRAGQVIGYVGTTGASTGAHLHGELLLGGSFADPVPYLLATPVKPVPKPRRKATTVSLFHKTEDGTTTFALAGESPGTDANWLETEDQAFANQLAKQHGRSAQLSPRSWTAWKARYLQPLKTA